MIITELYDGQGLGNQLWCYITTRVIAQNKGYEFGIKSPEKFKGLDFLNLDFGKDVMGGTGPEGGPPNTLPKGIKFHYAEKKIIHPLNGSDIRVHDKNLMNVEDCTKIDGLMQDEKYIIHKKDQIKTWLKVKEEYEFRDFSDNNICIINFRGGGYVNDKDFFLPPKYWENAINNMLKINKCFKFIVITDDPVTAKKFFPSFDVHHFSIGKDYSIIKNAKYLILSNSSFAWFPAWTSEDLKYCIAPKYWGRHNISDGYWSLGYNITTNWMYQDRKGKLYNYDTCIKELQQSIKKNTHIYLSKDDYKPSLINKTRNIIRIFHTLSNDVSKTKSLINIILLLTIQGAIKFNHYVRNLLKKPVTGITSYEERQIFNVLKNKFTVVFDVGVRDELSFYHMKNDCSYHLFEPNKDFTKMLKNQMSKFKNHKIKLNEYGLSDKKMDNCIYYEKSQAFLINPYFKEGDVDTGSKYSLRTLDDYVLQNNIPIIDFLKIDAEGLDYRIMLGGKDTIKKNKVSFIQFEYWDGVKKFMDLLEENFDLYLIMEPRLLRAITEKMVSTMTPEQKLINYKKSIIKLNPDLIDLIDKKLAPVGYGGNILGINKNITDVDLDKLTFDVNLPQTTSTNQQPGLMKKLKSKAKLYIKDAMDKQGYY